MASSRSWGPGAISWRPGHIRACVNVAQYHHQQFTPRKLVPVRAVNVTRNVVDDEGRLVSLAMQIELDQKLGDAMTVLQLKEVLCTKIEDVEPSRLRLARLGCELSNTQTLRDANVPHDADLHLRILRRDADRIATPAVGELRLAEPRPVGEPPELTALRLKTLAGRSSLLTGLSGNMDVRTLRSLVGRHALVRELDAAEAKADEGGKKDKADAKKGGAAAATEKAPEDEAPPGAGLLLFGVGSDLDLGSQANTPEPFDDDAVVEDIAGEQERGRASGSRHDAYPPLTPRGTNRLVHLRDGRELREYGLQHEAVIYVCRDTK